MTKQAITVALLPCAMSIPASAQIIDVNQHTNSIGEYTASGMVTGRR